MAAAMPLDEAKAKSVLRQVEFYFSDSNLPRDKFLRETVEQSDDGLVSLALICSFSRMKSHLGLDATVKPETVPEETVLAVAEVLRRSQVNSVRLPRHIASKKNFCGTALVEFSEEEEAKKVLENSLVFAGANLEIKPKKEFDAEQESKREEYEKVHLVKDSQDEGYPKGLIVAFKLKIIADPVVQNNEDKGNDSVAKLDTSDSMENPSGETSEERIPGSTDSKGEEAPDNMAKEKEVREATESEKCTSDALVESENQGNSGSLGRDVKNAISREDIKEVLKKFGTVRYVDFSIGDDSGYLRFEDSKAAEKARMASVLADEGGLIIKDHIITLEPVKRRRIIGAGFVAFKKITRTIEATKEGKQFNGKRGRNPDAEKNSNKAQKVEAAA
nr:unnamed protein product [Digitaria exilis]